MAATSNSERIRTILRYLLALVYAIAGIAHIRTPEPFLAITPDWVPYAYEVIIITGVCEIAGAAALLTKRWRYAAGVALALYAVCVYPANIKHAVENIAMDGETMGLGYHIPRLLFQPVFVWWALFAGGVINWPIRNTGTANDQR